MVAGRPRTVSPDPEKCIELGQDLVNWATETVDENEPLRSRFCEWYTLPKIGMIRNEWEALLKISEFRVYYERAQAALGRKFIDGTINPSIGHRLMWHYVPESKEQEIERMEKDAEIKKRYEQSQPINNYYLQSNIPHDTVNTNPIQIFPETLSTPDTTIPQ